MSEKSGNIIGRNFSKSASSYNAHSDIQILTAEKLIGFMDKYEYKNILEIGCGTGHYTLLLKKRYPDSKLTAVDISSEMIDKASERLKGHDVNFIEADGETIKLKERYDLVTSNAVFHWFTDLDSAVKSYKNTLTENGSVVFSFFGPKTFRELAWAIKSVAGNDFKISAESFLNEKQLSFILKSNFKKYIMREERLKNKAASLAELLSKIRSTGTRGVGVGNPYLFNKEALAKIEESYLQKSGAIVSTYQIFLCEAYL